MIRFEGVAFSYCPHQPILAGVDCVLVPGLTLLLGRNGSGKSTLLKLAAGIEKPDSGRVEIDGHDLWRDEVKARAGLAYVPEHADFTPYASVLEVLSLVGSLRGQPSSAVRAALATVSLEGLEHRSVRELSMGQRRRAVLAAALIGTPDHLILDEPLESLDRLARAQVVSWVEARSAAGAVVIVSAHDPGAFLATVAQVLVIGDGRCEAVPSLPREPSARLALLEGLARGEAQPRSPGS